MISMLELISDIRSFVLHKPPIPTLVKFESRAAREDYSHRIAQRIGIDVARYAILNIHRIGIEAPSRHVFEELLQWDGRPSYWPNRIVKVERTPQRLDELQFYLFGRKRPILGFGNGVLGLGLIPLFRMTAVVIQSLPAESDFDNARYLLYECSGGYPVGICGIYVRSSIKDRGEAGEAQTFFAVGFNFYGRESWSRQHTINQLWEGIHNRVTANVLNRFKAECEGSFKKIQAGTEKNLVG